MLQENWVGRVGVISHEGRVTSQHFRSAPQLVPVNVSLVKIHRQIYGEENMPVVLMTESDDGRRGRTEFVKAEICQFDYKPKMFN